MTKDTSARPPYDVLEGMTSLSALFRAPAENDRRVERVLIDRTRRRNKTAQIGFLTAKSHERGFPIDFVEPEELARYTDGKTHGGIIALCSQRTIPLLTPDRLIDRALYVYPEGIEDPYNFGYMVRSLYAAGAAGIVLPPQNRMNAAGIVARASAGTSELIPMYQATPEVCVESFRARGYRILCAGIRDSVSIFDEQFPYPVLLVVGGEKRGISRTLLDAADHTVRIDYGREFLGSLSAASAATVMAFELFRQNR